MRTRSSTTEIPRFQYDDAELIVASRVLPLPLLQQPVHQLSSSMYPSQSRPQDDEISFTWQCSFAVAARQLCVVAVRPVRSERGWMGR